MRELLRQCLPYDLSVLPLLYDKCATSAESKLESPAVLKDLLQTVLKGADKLAIVIDGLDECDEPQRKLTLSYLLPLIEEANRDSPGSMRALFTSQDVADMRKQLRKAEVVALTAQDNAADIRAYTKHWALQIQARFDLPGDEVRRITKHVTETAKGRIPSYHYCSPPPLECEADNGPTKACFSTPSSSCGISLTRSIARTCIRRSIRTLFLKGSSKRKAYPRNISNLPTLLPNS